MKMAVNTNTTVTNNIMLAQTVLNNAYEICGKRIASVPIALMEIDDSYQRVIGSTVKKLMDTWSNEKCDFLLVSFRDNRFYIIDGQHRYSVAKAKGIVALPCIIFTDLTQQGEALKFAQQQDNVNKLSPYDTFKANIACGDISVREISIDMEIKRVCDKYNIEVRKFSNNTQGKVLRSLSRTRNIVGSYIYDGVACFEWIIDIINMSNWAEVGEAYTREIILMLKSFWIDNINNNIKDRQALESKLIKILNSTTPKLIINKSKHDYTNYNTDAATSLCLRDMFNA